MRAARLTLSALAILGVCTLLTLDESAQPTGLAAPATSTSPAAAGKDLRTQALHALVKGRFDEGLTLLKDSTLESDDLAVRARTLAGDYLKVRAGADAERRDSLAAEQVRIRLARLTEQHRPKLVEAGITEDLFAKVEEMAEALGSADRLASLATTSQPADMTEQMEAYLRRALAAWEQAQEKVGDRYGEWGTAFQASGEALKRACEQYRQAWRKTTLPAGWVALNHAFEGIQDAMADMAVLTSRDPLVVALAHARLARDLTDEPEAFLQSPLIQELIRDAEQKGKELLAQKKWMDALAVYGPGGLSDLDEYNLQYQATVDRIHCHVRVLNLYGQTESGPTTLTVATRPAVKVNTGGAAVEPLDEPAVPEELPRWREMIAGIDTVMVRTAIGHIDDSYVERPDYRKMVVGALEAIQVLGETEQAANAFPSLKDAAKRDAFLKVVEGQLSLLRKKDTVDYLDVSLALNRVLDVNSETVNLPSEVVNMEFADGMLGELDKYTTMIWPYEEEDFNKYTMGAFFGIGIQIRKEPGKPIEVVTPLADSPALRAGVLAGDWIVQVDGQDTRLLSIDRAVKMITGPRQTKVRLTLRRAGRDEPFEVVVERDEIHVQTVKGWRAKADGSWDYFIDPDARIAYVRISKFTADTSEEIRDALKAVRQGGADGLILDLRFNPGGSLTAAIDVADEFLPRGLIVRTSGRSVPEASKDATALGEYQEGKVVILINRYTASAAEIVSGAMKDWGRAETVGERTYGKGKVQRLFGMKNKNAKLKVTTAYYYLPQGRCLDRTNGAKVWGVDPDLSAPVSVRQMNRWAEIRQETDILKNVDAGRLSSLLSQQLSEDMQLQTALLLVKLELLASRA